MPRFNLRKSGDVISGNLRKKGTLPLSQSFPWNVTSDDGIIDSKRLINNGTLYSTIMDGDLVYNEFHTMDKLNGGDTLVSYDLLDKEQRELYRQRYGINNKPVQNPTYSIDPMQNTIDQLNQRAAADPTFTVGDYEQQMRNLNGDYSGMNQQDAIDMINQRAVTDTDYTFEQYRKDMANASGDYTGYETQEAIDMLNKQATSDSSLTVEEYQRRMNHINNDTLDYTTQDKIDQLNQRAVSDPSLTVADYEEQMRTINNDYSGLDQQEAIDMINKRAAKDENYTVEEYINDMNKANELAEQQPIMDNSTTADPEVGPGPGPAPEPTPEPTIDIPDNSDDILKTVDREQYQVNFRNSRVDSITTESGTYNFMYGEDYSIGDAQLFDLDGNEITGDNLEAFKNAAKVERANYLNELSGEEWEDIINNPEKFGYTGFNDETTDFHRKRMNEASVRNERKAIMTNKRNDLQRQIDASTDKKIKKELEAQRDALDINILEDDKEIFRNKNKYEASLQRRKRYEELNKAEQAITDEASEQAYKETRQAIKEANKTEKKAIKEKIMANDELLDTQINALKGDSKFKFGKAFNTLFVAKTAVDSYKESRAEGKGVVSSTMRAGATAAVGEILGPKAYIAMMAAKALPTVAMKGADTLYREHRKMNSAANFLPLGGVNFQDSQELATMRQSGMELAKMSQYNLEQTLMGAEAKHLHR